MQITRREFLLQTGSGMPRLLARGGSLCRWRRAVRIDQRLCARRRLPGAGVRVSGRRQRREQHGDPDDRHRVQRLRNRPKCIRAGTSARHPAAINRRSAAAFGLHPSLAPFQALWDEQKLSVVCNVGPLVQPLTREDYQGGAPRPYQLFSHSDQVAQWQTSIADRVPDGLGRSRRRSVRGTRIGLPDDHRTLGRTLHTRPDHSAALHRPGADSAQPGARPERVWHRGRRSGATAARWKCCARSTPISSSSASASRTDPSGPQHRPNLQQRRQPRHGLPQHDARQSASTGRQGRQVQLLTPALGLNRQIFFCQLGGFDTHQGQVTTQANLLTQVSQAIKAFYDATLELGLDHQVTTFTLSDFGRTLQPAGAGNGVVGTDHAWGSHHIVVGGAVRGGDFFGVADQTARCSRCCD